MALGDSLNRSFTNTANKWEVRSQAAKQLGIPTGYIDQLRQEDLKRSLQGKTAMSDNEALATLATLVKGKGLVDKDDDAGDWWNPVDVAGNVVGDIKDIATGFVPAMASEVVNFPKHVVDAGLILGGREDVAEKYGIDNLEIGGLGDLLRTAAKVPIVNYIPGLYTASNLTTAEGRENILENPLITALDVLPAAKGASKLAAKAAGAVPESALLRQASKTRQGVMQGVLTKLEQGKRLNWDDLNSLDNAGLKEVINHAENPDTPIKVSDRDYGRASKLLDRRESGSLSEPDYMPSQDVIIDDVVTKEKILPATPGSAMESLAEAKPVQALSRATGISDKIIKPLSERLGTTPALRSIYSAFGGTLPRKYQPELERKLKEVGDALADIHKLLPEDQQATFYKDIMDAAMESADTVKAADLSPGVLSGVMKLREITDAMATNAVNFGDVVALLLPEGGTALYDGNSRAAKASAKVDQVMQQKPSDYSPDSPIEQHVKWRRNAEKVRNEYEAALNETAPLSFQKLIEDKILNQLAMTLMADENKVRFAEEAAEISDRLRQGKNATTEEIGKLSTEALQSILDNSQGISSRQTTKVLKEINRRKSTGDTGPEPVLTPAFIEQIVQKISSGDYLKYMTKDQFDAMVLGTVKYWRELKAKGYEPIPVPYVKRNHDIFKDTFIQPIPEGMSKTDISRFREAVFDFKPYQRDLSVALSREAVEQLRYDASRALHTEHIDKLSRNPEGVLREYAEMHPNLDRAELHDKIMEDFVAYDAQLDRPFRAQWEQGVDDTGARLLPKNVATQVRNLAPRDRLPVNGVFNKINKTFRFAVLTTPRHVADIALGGMVEMLSRDPIAIKEIFNGFRMAKNKQMPFALPRSIDGFATHEVFPLTPMAVEGWGTNQMFNYAGGRTIGRLAKMHVRFRKFEEFLTDAQRSTDYLYNKKKQLKKGMSEEYAERAAIESASKALATYEDMSPFERQYIRTYLPFYGFTRHITRYLLSYPGDHPYKASILSQIANREVEDWNSGFPRTWNNLFFLGAPNKAGDQWVMDLRVLNPFRTAYNNFTFAGILSQQTPFIGAPMAFLGIDPASGSGELYPELSYDPQSGSLVTKRNDGLLKVAQQFIPQVGIADKIFGLSEEMRQLNKNNPEAARQRMYSILGINFAPKQVNIPETVARTQSNQISAAQQVVSNAMAGGGTRELRKYSFVPFQGQMLPGDQVADMIDQLKELIEDNPQLAELGVTPRALLGR